MAGNYDGLIGQSEHSVIQRGDDFAERSAWEIRPPNASREQCVASDQLPLRWEVNTCAPLGMSWRVHRKALNGPAHNHILILQTLIDLDRPRRRSADPRSLNVQHLQQRVVALVQENGCAGGLLELHCPTYVIDVRMSDYDLLEFELMFSQNVENVFDLVAGIDHQRLPRALVSNDGAIATKHADGKDLVNQWSLSSWCELLAVNTNVTNAIGQTA